MHEQTAKRKVFDKKQALAKAEHFCAYQERSQQEVRDKLYTWGILGYEVEEIISELIQRDFLNEERFAVSYTLGKFRIKHWGKIKIKQGLKLKRVPEKLITKALTYIDGNEYEVTILKLLQKKATLLNEKDPFKRKYKLMQYVAAKGFEKDLIQDILKDNNL